MPQAIGLFVLEALEVEGGSAALFGIAGAPSLAGVVGGGSLLGTLTSASTLFRKTENEFHDRGFMEDAASTAVAQ